MQKLHGLEPSDVFKYFEEICNIPHGSENMKDIAEYCINFAKYNNLEFYTDDANNVVIFKDATRGYEDSEPIILQGHLDMVCQKTEDSDIDFIKDGLDIYVDGDFVKANGTTLGADNGIAVAMILSILASQNVSHPPMEAVFTTDEEIGMIGAGSLDMSVLRSKRMINLDAEEDDTVTVSCAGGSDLVVRLPVKRDVQKGRYVKIALKGLQGGHSGVEINSGRVNSNILAGRILSSLNDFDIISISGGEKGNAIANNTLIELCVYNVNSLKNEFSNCVSTIRDEIAFREPNFTAEILQINELDEELSVFTSDLKEDILFILNCVPNGVIDMSSEIKGLVETSLNLGILRIDSDEIVMHYTLRSNKNSSLFALENKMKLFFSKVNSKVESFGHYPPWEYNNNSKLQEVYKKTYKEICCIDAKVEAIHAGLECGVFASKISGFDCIAIGPQLYDVHTVNERISITSTKQTYKILLKLLENLR